MTRDGASYPAGTWRQLAGFRSAMDSRGVSVASHPVPRLYLDGRPAV